MTATECEEETAPAPTHEYPDAVRMALAAVATTGVSFFLCHLPYGRIATVLLSLAAVALAGLSLLGLARRAWLGWAGVSLNAVFALLLVGFPGAFGLEGWWPAGAPDAPEAAVERTGITADGWVDAGEAAWEEDGVQVGLTFVTVAPPPEGGDARLWIGVRVTNGGTRTIDFAGWDAAAPGGPALATLGGAPVAGRRAGAPERKALAPGQSAECVIAFATPPSGLTLRLELPASAYGGTTPARFQIAPDLILRK